METLSTQKHQSQACQVQTQWCPALFNQVPTPSHTAAHSRLTVRWFDGRSPDLVGVGPPTQRAKQVQGSELATRSGQTQTTREDDNLVTSDLEKAALIGRQVNRMEEVGSLIFRSTNRPWVSHLRTWGSSQLGAPQSFHHFGQSSVTCHQT